MKLFIGEAVKSDIMDAARGASDDNPIGLEFQLEVDERNVTLLGTVTSTVSWDAIHEWLDFLVDMRFCNSNQVIVSGVRKIWKEELQVEIDKSDLIEDILT